MSTGATLSLDAQFAVAAATGVGERRKRRTLGALLVEAQMSEVAAFEFLGGAAAVFTSRAPQKDTPNEDVAALWPLGPTSGVLAVADGLGGHAGGERASRIAIEAIQKSFQQAGSSPADNGEPNELRAAILNGIESANAAVRELGTGAATTMALVEIQDNTIRTYHVGDSAILVTGQRGKMKLQTICHSPIGYAVEAGLMKEEDAIHHEARHVISNVIGSEQMRIEIGPPTELAPRDTLLIASDGLFDNLLPDEIVETIRSGPLDDSVRMLVELAQRRMETPNGTAPSKPDDLTIIAYRPR